MTVFRITIPGKPYAKFSPSASEFLVSNELPEDPRVATRKGARVKATNEQLVKAYEETGSVWKAAELLGMSGTSVHERLKRLGLARPMNVFGNEDVDRLKREYQAAADAGKLEELAASMGRTKQFICRKASGLGLTKRNRAKPYLIDEMSARQKAWIAENGHPKGALGMKHSAEAKERMAEGNRQHWAKMSDEQKSEFTMRQLKAKVEKYGTPAPNVSRGSWKAGWREIGVVRKFYRSRWEANYALYLEWLRENGQIASWQHEPETFWFEDIKRGVRSYLPDFLVTENNGSQAYHEVKGWMDSRSKTTIKRFGKYYPQHTLIVIDTKGYQAIARKMSSLIEGWE